MNFRAIMFALLLAAAIAPGQQQPYQDRFLTVNGLRLHYLDWGGEGKQPFIMVHGIGRVAHSFDHIAPRFAANYHIYAIDMRGHGDSGWSPEGAYLVEDHAKDLEAFVEQLNLRNVVLLGNSTGGRVVQVYAGMHPSEAKATDALLSRLRYYETPPELARIAGRLQYDWRRKGHTLSLADVLIAATALHYGLTLLTDNAKHFPMPQLTLHAVPAGMP